MLLRTLLQPTLVFGCWLIGSMAFGAGQFEFVALTGDATPDGAHTYGSFDTVGVNVRGELAYVASYVDLNGENGSTGIFYHTGSSANELVSFGDTVPDGNGTYRRFWRVKLDDSGQVLFESTLENTNGGNADDYGAFVTDGVNQQEVFRDSYPTPPGTHNYGRPRAPLFTNSGQIAFWSTVSGFNHYGIYRSDGTTTEELARSDLPIPNSSGNYGTLVSPDINESGEVAFLSHSFNSFGMNEGPFRSIIVDSGSGPSEILRAGMTIPNETDTLGDFTNVDVNNHGALGFSTYKLVIGQGASEAIYLWEDGVVTEQVQIGDPILGTSDTLGDLAYYSMQMNDRNEFVFLGRKSGSATNDLFRRSEGGLERIVGPGDAAPAKLGETPTFSSISGAILDDFGRVFFNAGLQNTAEGTADDRALYVYENGQVTELLREGDEIAGHTITSWRSTFSDGAALPFSEPGYFGLNVALDDGRFGIVRLTADSPFNGDFDGNGFVNQADLTLWTSAYATSNAADSDWDNDSDGADFLQWQLNFDQPAQQRTVPEPSTLVLIGVCIPMVVSSRRGTTASH